MDSQRYMFGAAAVGMAVAVVLIFNDSGSAGASSSAADMTSFSVEAESMSSIDAETEKAGPERAILDRQVRVILPSPYESASRRSLANDER